MLLSNFFRKQLAVLQASDPIGLAPAALPNKIALLMADFTPSEDLVIGNVTLATFTGSTPIAGFAGAQEWQLDPLTNEWINTIIEPANGWRWEVGDATGLPQTIYGYALLSNTLAVLHGVEKLPAPITLTLPNQAIDIGSVQIRFVLQPCR